MIQVNEKSSENIVNFPKNQNLTGNLVLKLHSEITQKTYTFNVADEGSSKRFYKFTLDFSNLEDGEYNYNINDVETGLIRIGLVEQSTPSVIAYTDEVNIIQYREDNSSYYRLQNKEVTYTENGENLVTADPEYYGLKNVVVNVEVPVDEYYEEGYTSGVTDGIAEQKSKLSSIEITQNGTYTSTNGYSAITVTVSGYTQADLDAAYASGWSAGYVSGYTDGSQSSDYSKQYLTFEIISGGTINWLYMQYTQGYKTISYSKDNGSSWSAITSTIEGVKIDVSAGDKVLFKGNIESNVNGSFFGSTNALFNISGNILSLVYNDDFIGKDIPSSENLFSSMFKETGVVSAENLVLPNSTYNNCYYNMFGGCTSLTTAPKLPATTLAYGCYRYMFQNCTSLTTAPALPATTLAMYCYMYMFAGCTGLTTAPTLPATNLPEWCYSYMFQGCSSLNYIKCLATDISASYCTEGWVRGVSSTGTFVKKSGASWSTGNKGIPTNWTVIDAE